jgi:protein TonB
MLILCLFFASSVHANNKANNKNASEYFNYTKEYYLILDTAKCQSYVDSITKSEIFIKADTMPEYIGGKTKMFVYIFENLDEIYYHVDIFGFEEVQLIIGETGKISNIKIIKGLHPSFDNEILRIIEMMPNWKPGKCGNKEVPVQISFTIKMPVYETK